MKTDTIIKTLCVLLTVSIVGFCAVKGPAYYDLRAMGMGNTTVAVTTDRTAIFHNPAGLSLLKDKVQVSISPLIFSIDGKFFKIANAMVQQGDKLSDISQIDADFINMLNDLDGEWVGFEYIPEVTVATNNLGFGMYTVLPVGVRLESGHLIPKLGLRGERDLVFTWAVGVPLKAKNTHMGISVEYLQRTPLEETITTYSETFIYFDKMSGPDALGIIGDKADIQHGVSFDIGMMHDFSGFRLAYDIKDILGIIGGQMVFPPRIDLGCAYYFPWMENLKYIDNFIIAFEFSDLFGVEPVTEKYEHPAKKIHFGAELDLHYAAIRLGLNQGYPTAGLGIRLGLFKLDYVFFTKEVGYYPGQLAKMQHVLSMGVGFNVNRRERKHELDNEYRPEDFEEQPVQKSAPVQTNQTQINELPEESETEEVQQEPVEAVEDAPLAPVQQPIDQTVPQQQENLQKEPEPVNEKTEPAQKQETPQQGTIEEQPQEQTPTQEESIGWE